MQDALVEFIDRQCKQEVIQAVESQKKKDVLNATGAFVALNQDDGQIYNLLLKYFGVNNISLAKEHISTARILSQMDKMSDYCDQEGIDYRQYCKKHSLREKLESTPKLLYMAPDKLNAYLEKHN